MKNHLTPFAHFSLFGFFCGLVPLLVIGFACVFTTTDSPLVDLATKGELSLFGLVLLAHAGLLLHYETTDKHVFTASALLLLLLALILLLQFAFIDKTNPAVVYEQSLKLLAAALVASFGLVWAHQRSL